MSARPLRGNMQYLVVVHKYVAGAFLHGVVVLVSDNDGERAGARHGRKAIVCDGNLHLIVLLLLPIKCYQSHQFVVCKQSLVRNQDYRGYIGLYSKIPYNDEFSVAERSRN